MFFLPILLLFANRFAYRGFSRGCGYLPYYPRRYNCGRYNCGRYNCGRY